MSELSNLKGVSVVVCTYNGKYRLEKTLIHVLRQSTSVPFEILVVDNASVDGTAEWVMNFGRLHDHKLIIRIVSEKKPGLSSARIRGIKEARYPIILFCDDDNWLSHNYLEIGLQHFDNNPNLGALGGEGIPIFEIPKPDWFDKYSHSYAVGDWGLKSGVLPKGSAVYGAGCFFRKSVLDSLLNKGWNSLLSDRKGNSLSSGGDIELCYSIQLLGFSVGFDKKLKFQHYIEKKRLNWEYYLKLKEGISISFPILSAYNLDYFPTLKDFRNHLFSCFLILIKGLIKTVILPKNTYQRQVDFRVVRAKFWAFLKNYRTALNGYKLNR